MAKDINTIALILALAVGSIIAVFCFSNTESTIYVLGFNQRPADEAPSREFSILPDHKYYKTYKFRYKGEVPPGFNAQLYLKKFPEDGIQIHKGGDSDSITVYADHLPPADFPVWDWAKK